MNGTAPSGLTATVSPWQEELHQQGPGTYWRDAGAQPTSPTAVVRAARFITAAREHEGGAFAPPVAGEGFSSLPRGNNSPQCAGPMLLDRPGSEKGGRYAGSR